MKHLIATLAFISLSAFGAERPNVLFIISDDLTATALSCYGNTVCKTPNIDRLASQGTRFTKAYCQGTYCGPSRASFMSGYYPFDGGSNDQTLKQIAECDLHFDHREFEKRSDQALDLIERLLVTHSF